MDSLSPRNGNYTASLSKVMAKIPKFATLLPAGSSTIPKFTSEDASDFHRRPNFVDKIRMDADHLARSFFSRSDEKFYITQNAVHIEEITRAFIEAGIPPVAIISWSIFNKPATEPIVPLSLALAQYAVLQPIEQELYGEVYRQHLKDFTAQDIVDSCLENQTIEAVYRLTGDKAIIKSANNVVRDACFGNDLGL